MTFPPLTGHSTRLRLVTEDDADYIFRLRSDSRYNTHLSAVSGSPETQRDWIRSYKAREAAGQEYYFVIERADDETPCGVVRVYGIHNGKFTWGSWILDENKPPKAALDTALLVYRFGFHTLGLEMSIYDVRKQNANTLAFHDRFGGRRIDEDEHNIYYELPAELFRELDIRHRAAFEAAPHTADRLNGPA